MLCERFNLQRFAEMQLVITAGAILCRGDTDSTADVPTAVQFNQNPVVWGPRGSKAGGLVPAPCMHPEHLASQRVPQCRERADTLCK